MGERGCQVVLQADRMMGVCVVGEYGDRCGRALGEYTWAYGMGIIGEIRPRCCMDNGTVTLGEY